MASMQGVHGDGTCMALTDAKASELVPYAIAPAGTILAADSVQDF